MIVDLWENLKNETRPIVLYGMGNGADKILNVCESKGITISGVFASDGFVKNKTFRGFKITDYKTAKETFGNMVVLVCFGSGRDDVLQNIKRISKETALFVPDVPVYGNTLFDLNFAKENKEKLQTVYNMLCDEQSKRVFENTVLFKISGNPNYLYEIETERNETLDISGVKKAESFLDLGAYNGDTAVEFLNYSENAQKIIAVEPDIRSFNKLCKNTENLKEITAVNCAISNSETIIHLADKKGRGTSIGNVGKEVNCTTVDKLLNGEKIDYIKFDIEGNELNGIKGAKNAIKEHKPTLCIAAYHKSEDLFSIPLAVNEIRCDYNLYMRHTKCLPAWDIDFIFK